MARSPSSLAGHTPCPTAGTTSCARPRVTRVGPWPARAAAAARSACCWPISDAARRWPWRPAIARSVPTERSVQPPCAGPEVSARFVDPHADPRTCRYSAMAPRPDSSADRVAAPTLSSTSESNPHWRRSSAHGRRPVAVDTADRPPPSTCTRPIRSLRHNALREGRTVAYLHGPPRQSSASDGHVFAPDLWRSLSSVGEGQRQRARLEDGRDEVSVCRRDRPAVGQLTGRMSSVKGCAALCFR